jgi:hypothetical protein
VPEAAVNEYGQAFAMECEIGLSGQRLMPTPAGYTVRSHNGQQLELRIPIALRRNCRHHL